MIATRLLVAGLLLLTAACAAPAGSPGAVADIGPGERPALDTDEAGLWMTTDRLEEEIKTSGRLIENRALNAYVRDVVCRLSGPYCDDIRIYLLRQPHFNASMMPNGTMQVWSGLLLRAQNEAQLAYVLGHELGHYLRRHTLQQWRDVRMKSNLLVFFSLATAAGGVGYAGGIAELVALASVFQFSRDQEREADDVGLRLMAEAGYDPREAHKVWAGLIEEKEADEDSGPPIFFATHPTSEERQETLERKAGEAEPAGPAIVGRDRYLDVILPMRAMLLRDELRQRAFKRTRVVLDRLLEEGLRPGELRFFEGEFYRLRGEDGDAEKALAAYEQAAGSEGAPPETFRAIALLHYRAGETDKARVYFERYLAAAPQAEDRAMIETYLDRI